MFDFLELCKKTGLEPKRVASTHGGEYKSPCLKCGGTDRFMVWPNRQYTNCTGGYFCRQCGKGGDCIQFCIDYLEMTWSQAIKATNSTVDLDKRQQRFIPKQSAPKAAHPPSEVWMKKSEDLVHWASNQILQRTDVLEELSKRGLSLEAVKRYRIGYIENKMGCKGDFYVPRSQFGLKEELNKNGRPKSVWIPHGLLIPSIEPSGKIIRLKVRRADYKTEDGIPKYFAIPGSMGGLNLVGDRFREAIVVVESELDGCAVHHAVGDHVLAISVGSNSKNPDSFTDFLVKESKTLLICHDSDKAGLVMRDKWIKLYFHAKAYPTPDHKDIGDAAEGGVDIREWLMSGLSCRNETL